MKNKLKQDKVFALKEAQFKDDFLASMSHEIRTPLNGVIGMLDILGATELNNQQLEYVHTINDSAGLLLSIINDILDLSKIQFGKLNMNPSNFNIQKAVHATTDLYYGIAKEKGITLKSNYNEGVPDYLIADPNRAIHIMNNLISNAIKFTASGSVTIDVSVENGHLMKIKVIDTGKGIPEETQNKLWDKFYQVKDGEGSSIKGTGLGLAICKELTRLMQGDIGVESQIGQGSTFWFTFEFKQGNNKVKESIKERKANLSNLNACYEWSGGHEKNKRNPRRQLSSNFGFKCQCHGR